MNFTKFKLIINPLINKGIKMIILDVDGTLLPWNKLIHKD